ncbi:hypothetical protein ACLOJK_020877 [Asimina triloba]
MASPLQLGRGLSRRRDETQNLGRLHPNLYKAHFMLMVIEGLVSGPPKSELIMVCGPCLIGGQLIISSPHLKFAYSMLFYDSRCLIFVKTQGSEPLTPGDLFGSSNRNLGSRI